MADRSGGPNGQVRLCPRTLAWFGENVKRKFLRKSVDTVRKLWFTVVMEATTEITTTENIIPRIRADVYIPDLKVALDTTYWHHKNPRSRHVEAFLYDGKTGACSGSQEVGFAAMFAMMD